MASAAAEVESRAAPPGWSLRDEPLTLEVPLVVGILNVTPDSFSDGGLYESRAAALRRGEEMVSQGAGMLDVGGESTRPGARPVEASEEAARVVPIIRLLKSELAVPVSVDTRRATVALAALEAGADAVNDVSSLADPAMASIVAEAGAGLVLMHMRGTPETMQEDPRYGEVVAEVRDELQCALLGALEAGIERDRIVMDPGIGFAKSHRHNLELIARLGELSRLGRPIMLGASRKAFLGAILGGRPPAERAVATAAACVAGLLQGARIFRVHDVRVVRDALLVAEAVRTSTAEAS